MIRPNSSLACVLGVIAAAPSANAELLPNGVSNDEQTSIVYYPGRGEMAVDAPASSELTSINVESGTCFGYTPSVSVGQDNLGGSFGPLDDDPCNLVKWTFGGSFGSISFGNVAQPGLSQGFVIGDLTAVDSLAGGGDLGPVDLVYMHDLFPGDANRDFSFDQLDLVRVLQAGKYLTGQPATWGEGDWDGAPGGSVGDPLAGDGLFDQLDIIKALASGLYMTGPYAAVRPEVDAGETHASVGNDATTGESWGDAPDSTELTSASVDSAAGGFTAQAAANLGGSFDNDSDINVFKATFGSSFGSLIFGNVAQTGLSADFVANDLTVVGSLAGGGDLGNVDLICIPEPSALLLALLGIVGLLHWRR